MLSYGNRGNEVRASRARRFAADLAPTIKGIQKAGTTSLRGIADELNRRGVLTASGKGKWISSMVWRLLDSWIGSRLDGYDAMAPIVGLQCFVARSALGWSARHFARAAKVSQHTVVRFESGDVLRATTVEKI
jgi:hypothetical protein